MKLLLACVSFLLTLGTLQTANILGVTTLVSHSHHFWNEVLAVGLAEKGHNVTLISHDKKKKDHPNYSLIVMEGVYEKFDYEFENTENDPSIAEYWKIMRDICELDLETEALKTLLSYPPDFKFDLILWDITAGECLYPIIKRFGNPPVVLLSAFGLQPFISHIMGSHVFNYIPFYDMASTDRNIGFWGRLESSYKSALLLYTREEHLDASRELSKRVFGDVQEDFRDIERKFTVALVNNEPNFDYPHPMPPNIIPVGGLQIEEPKPLSKNLEEIFTKAKNGVIYFALGSNIKAERITDDKIKAFSDCFETLPYTILWKIDWNGFKLANNIITRTWLPQSDILAHTKVKLFITHGGSLSTHEAMHRGVPLVSFPFFLDQKGNTAKLVERGLATQIDYHLVSKDYVCEKIKEVLNNETYAQNMKAVSRRVRDQESTPLNRAIFWVEYILRHGTGDHLSAAPRYMSVIEKLNLDIALLILIVCSTPVFLLILCCVCLKTKPQKLKLKLN